MSSLKEKVISGVFWRLLERLGTQSVGFIVSLVLARLLTPNDFGTVAVLSIFIAVSETLVNGGFATALVQKKNITELDLNSIFYLNLIVSCLVYMVLFCLAPWLARYFEDPVLRPVLRWMGLLVIIYALNGIQNAVLIRGMLFNRSFRINLVRVLISGTVGITLACMGYGVWALVSGTLAGGGSACCVRWFLIGWRPRLLFSLTAVRTLFRYSWKLLLSGLLDSAFSNLSGLVIGKVYSKSTLGIYNRGNSLPQLVMDSINQTIGSVSFPALSRMQDDPEQLRSAVRKMIQSSCYLVFPAMTGLALCAKPVILMLYGEKWVESIPFVQIACFGFALWPFHTINLQAINAIGRSDVFLKLEVMKKIIALLILFISFRFGVIVLACAMAFVFGPLGVLINAWPSRYLLNYSVKMQLCDVFPTVGLCLAMAFASGWLLLLKMPNWLCVFLIMMVGASIYILLSIVSKNKAFYFYWGLIVKGFHAVFKRWSNHSHDERIS